METLSNLIIFLLIGLVAGYLAGLIVKGSGFGLLGNLIIGVIGALVGGFVAPLVGIGATNLLGRILVATGGAILLLFLLGIAMRNRKFP